MTGFVCELTPKCNLRCRFCYNTWRTPGSAQPSPLPPDVFAGLLIETLHAADADWLAFAGGEPLLYPDLEQLLQLVSASLPGVRLGLLSNGTLLTEQRLAGLVDCGLGYVELSLFAASAERYRALTGSDELDSAHAAMLSVRQQGLPLTVACTLLADGLDQFADILLTAAAFGANMFALNPYTPTGHGRLQQPAFALSRARLAQFLALADSLAAQTAMPVVVTLPVEDCVLPHARYPHLRFSACQCARQKWVIDPQGNLRTCEQNQAILGNLAEQSFTLLADGEAARLFRERQRRPACAQCPSFSRCGGGCRFRAC